MASLRFPRSGGSSGIGSTAEMFGDRALCDRSNSCGAPGNCWIRGAGAAVEAKVTALFVVAATSRLWGKSLGGGAELDEVVPVAKSGTDAACRVGSVLAALHEAPGLLHTAGVDRIEIGSAEALLFARLGATSAAPFFLGVNEARDPVPAAVDSDGNRSSPAPLKSGGLGAVGTAGRFRCISASRKGLLP